MTSPRPDIRALLAAANVVLGPMAGITEAPFRAICKRMGAGLTFTEMVSATGLHYNPDAPASRALLTLHPDEVPCAVQLFGADPEVMAEQARRVVERYGEDIAIIDVNMGCPVSKVVSKGEGSALMRTPELAASIVSRMVERCGARVSVKFRTGWDADTADPAGFARRMEAAGASMLTIHARTRGQFYRGPADWTVIAMVTEAVDIPVIGSGDVFSATDAARMLDETGVDAVMVARGAQGDPWIFRECRALIDTGMEIAPPTAEERISVAREHAAALVEFGGPHAVARMRKHVAWYLHGLPNAASVRERAYRATTYDELDGLLAEYGDRLAGPGQ
ncbi:MAG TPA: tRNA dihydrouridine synthase DusB [Coriobacteriia bacterium]